MTESDTGGGSSMAPDEGSALALGVPGLGTQPGAMKEEAPLTPQVHGEWLLRVPERTFLYIDRLLTRLLPEPLNPMMQTGAVAITSLIIATVTGIILLIWYRPSVHFAYESVAAMTNSPFTAGLVRSLHRYSSDAAMFFGIVHALRVFVERRFTGPRWLAWVTGNLSMGVLWFVGWSGYWLVWDERAHRVAVGTARVLDVVPIFTDPLGRSFLADGSVNSLLFFVVFFVHMLLPLAAFLLLWIHLTRLSRPRFLTRTPLTLWTVGSLVLLSIVLPAENAAEAQMTAISQAFSMDWWYLLPLVLTDRLDGGALWAGLLVGGSVLMAVPWLLSAGGRRPAEVNGPKCNACKQCYEDCPYEAISMIPRQDEAMRFPIQAHVDPALCTGCGVCAGSCDSVAIGLDYLAVADQRKQLEAWVNEARDAGEVPFVALVCAESAAGILEVDDATGRCDQLPGFHVLRLPCAAWTHMLTVERLLRRGAEGVVIAGCAPGDCRSREGDEWLTARLEGSRSPSLRVDKVDPDRILVLALNRTRGKAFLSAARAFQESGTRREEVRPGGAVAGATALALGLVLALTLGVASDLGYAPPPTEASELVVTLKQPGMVSEDCHEFTPEELAELPIHMRREKKCERRRAPVRLRVTVDGKPMEATSHPPTGIWGDGSSVAVEVIPMSLGEHRVRVEIGNSLDLAEWQHATEETLVFSDDARRVVTFDRITGFAWE
ncbi:MAG: hydrogenase iron-sulfur subunit [bacterium]|nr:hydrogenase iron-sulfur subunit [bacterium]